MSVALRVVLDTNVLLSGIAYPSSTPGRIVNAWRQGSIEVVLSEFIIEELRRVLPKLVHRHRLSATEIDDLVDILSIQAEIISPDTEKRALIRDTNAVPVLGTLISAMGRGNIDYLVTGDKDLLALAADFPIISPADFWTRHR